MHFMYNKGKGFFYYEEREREVRLVEKKAGAKTKVSYNS